MISGQTSRTEPSGLQLSLQIGDLSDVKKTFMNLDWRLLTINGFAAREDSG